MTTGEIIVTLQQNCEDPCPYFEAKIILDDQQPINFEAWAEKVRQCKYRIFMPDGTRTSAKLFIDVNQRFNDLEFTNYLLNQYNGIYG